MGRGGRWGRKWGRQLFFRENSLIFHVNLPGPEVIIFFFLLNSLEHKIFSAKNMKMPTIVGIFIFISGENSMLSYI